MHVIPTTQFSTKEFESKSGESDASQFPGDGSARDNDHRQDRIGEPMLDAEPMKRESIDEQPKDSSQSGAARRGATALIAICLGASHVAAKGIVLGRKGIPKKSQDLGGAISANRVLLHDFELPCDLCSLYLIAPVFHASAKFSTA